MYITNSQEYAYKLIYMDESANSQTWKLMTEEWGVPKLKVKGPDRGSREVSQNNEKPKLMLDIPKMMGILPTCKGGKQ
jgi:hypothetical protein